MFNTFSFVFNVQKNTVEPKYFRGLPIPAAASFVASLVLFTTFLGGLPESRHFLIIVLIYVLSFLMVSTIEYPSFKELELKKQKPFSVLVATILILTVIAYKPKIMLFIVLAIYIISGPVITMYRLRKKRATADTPLEEATPVERE